MNFTAKPHDFSSSDQPVTPAIASEPTSDQLLSAYDYELPEERIAQNPIEPRDQARLLVLNSPTQHSHRIFRDLPNLLRSGDLLVLNNTRVIPARLYGRKPGGATIEVLLLEPQPQPNCWLALVKPGRRLKPGAAIEFGPDPTEPPSLKATVIATDAPTGGRILQFEVPDGESLQTRLQELGQVPLPPYITQSEAEPERYQTVYAAQPGAVAAPTAGLHFTPELLAKLQAQGIDQAFVTLHVGVGTFRPVEAEDITQHAMHSEWVEVPAETVAKIQQTKAQGGRVIAVGTTVVRTLEGVAQQAEQNGNHFGELQPYQGKVNLFIYPGYQWRVVEGLITNFHLPCSSLLMLVSALVSRPRLMALYQEAIAEQYRFYSFGDAMLVLPEARI
ncbi:tRNA preQ1(34) S-adenosylmethionine ribosyltransferase-isomerase QueA [Trichocoleus sp. FACHB-591]|uniref:tRNA preQ1(34) S-adenosylmethionine ribosyltransferase-isomerase QueA n=1 Tax=Trichocoleus sp. FACHB-591 TaxID=2692872 RepID=UPI001682068E|nr:tRNA preQ1(34) S-adenosylmethionine ribosyltransferase-isomerase QueA [Trichocoleus sp. FACHB-591]MBD2098346.1 tRNA preQ1(34) S-adenosylmethionine ribosyltransferase-isomerase QueA [Trichocoleus sp. FACHB-591]